MNIIELKRFSWGLADKVYLTINGISFIGSICSTGFAREGTNYHQQDVDYDHEDCVKLIGVDIL